MLIASSADLPLGASGPVSAMPKPILIGSPCWARVGAWNRSAAPAARRTAASPAKALKLRCRNMSISSRVAIFVDVLCPKPGARAKGDRQHGYCRESQLLRRIAAFDDDGLDLAGAAAPECRGFLVFRRGEAGDRLVEGRELDHHEAVELVRPLHQLIAPPARQDFGAVALKDSRQAVGVFLVRDRIVDLRAGDPIGGHALASCVVGDGPY